MRFVTPILMSMLLMLSGLDSAGSALGTLHAASAGAQAAPKAPEQAKEVSTPSSQPELRVLKVLDTEFFAGVARLEPLRFEIGPSGAIVIQSENNIYDVGGKTFLSRVPLENLSAVSFAGERLLFVAEGWLQARQNGGPARLLEIPLHRLRMVSDKEKVYLAGVTGTGQAALFLYVPGKGYQHILNLPRPVDAMELVGERLFFAQGPGIFSFRPGQTVRMEAALPGFKKLRALAVDPDRGVIYFSSERGLYAITPSDADFTVLTSDRGGELKFYRGGLYLLSESPPALYRIEGLSEVLLPENPLLASVSQRQQASGPAKTTAGKPKPGGGLAEALAALLEAAGARDVARRELEAANTEKEKLVEKLKKQQACLEQARANPAEAKSVLAACLE